MVFLSKVEWLDSTAAIFQSQRLEFSIHICLVDGLSVGSERVKKTILYKLATALPGAGFGAFPDSGQIFSSILRQARFSGLLISAIRGGESRRDSGAVDCLTACYVAAQLGNDAETGMRAQ